MVNRIVSPLFALLSTVAMTAVAADAPPKDAKVQFELFNPLAANNEILGHLDTEGQPRDPKNTLLGDPLGKAFPAQEATVAATCSNDKVHDEAGLLLAGLAWVVDKAVGWAVDGADKGLQSALKKYTATYDASKTDTFYVATDGATAAKASLGPIAKAQCFRLTRRTTSGNEVKIAMDFIGSFTLVDRKYLLIKPLRLYYAEALAETDKSDTYGVSIAMKMSTIWRENNRGHSEDTLASTKLLSEKIKLDGKHPFYQRYNIKGSEDDAKLRGEDPKPAKVDPNEKAPEPPLVYAALPPWSTWDGQTYEEDRVTTTLTVAEVGSPSWLLKTAAGLFHDNKDAVSKNLQAAAEKAVGVSSASSSAGK